MRWDFLLTRVSHQHQLREAGAVQARVHQTARPGIGFWLQRGGLCRGRWGASFPRVSSSIPVPALGRHCPIEAVWQPAAARRLLSKSCTLEINGRQLW